MNDTKELTMASLLLTIVFISFSCVSIIVRFSIEVAVLIFACKNINIKYSNAMAIIIPIYSISTNAFPSILRPYIIFIIASNLVFVVVMDKTSKLDSLSQALIASMAKIMVTLVSINFTNDIVLVLSLIGLIEVTIIGCIIGGIMYSKAIQILHSRKILS